MRTKVVSLCFFLPWSFAKEYSFQRDSAGRQERAAARHTGCWEGLLTQAVLFQLLSVLNTRTQLWAGLPGNVFFFSFSPKARICGNKEDQHSIRSLFILPIWPHIEYIGCLLCTMGAGCPLGECQHPGAQPRTSLTHISPHLLDSLRLPLVLSITHVLRFPKSTEPASSQTLIPRLGYQKDLRTHLTYLSTLHPLSTITLFKPPVKTMMCLLIH